MKYLGLLIPITIFVVGMIYGDNISFANPFDSSNWNNYIDLSKVTW